VVYLFIAVLLCVVVGLSLWIRHLRAEIRQMAVDHRKQVLAMLRDAERIEAELRKELLAAKTTDRWVALDAAHMGGYKDGVTAAKRAVRRAAAVAAAAAIDELLKK